MRPRKGWGQHFLTDGNVLRRIAREAKVALGETVLEIGPGLGALTEVLVAAGARVVAVERDPLMAASLARLGWEGLNVVQEDFLRFDLTALGAEFKVVANLPYCVTTPILVRLLPARPSRMVLTMQKEVAQRLTAAPGGKVYGSLSLFARYYADVETLFRISPTCFYPPPEVESAVVLFHPVPPRLAAAEEEVFFRLLRAGFTVRRKTLRNALKGWSLPTDPPVDLDRRAETLSLEEFLALAQIARPPGHI